MELRPLHNNIGIKNILTKHCNYVYKNANSK